MPTAALLLVGNEILSGRTQDANLAFLARRLGDVGIDLVEARVIPDIPGRIQASVNELRVAVDYLFTTGGIGPTHDDITAENIAAALGLPLTIHPEAHRRLAAFYQSRDLPFNEARLRMAHTPEGARLIDNPISVAPGFIVENIHVMAGVPRIMQAMVEHVLPTLEHGVVVGSRTVVCDLPEGLLAKPFGQLQDRFDQVDLGSYPGKSGEMSRVSLVARSRDQEQLELVEQALVAMVNDLGGKVF